MEIAAGIVATALFGLIGIVWSMLNDKINANRAECEERDKRIWEQVGRDSFSGMRKIVHAQDGVHELAMELDRRVDALERKP